MDNNKKNKELVIIGAGFAGMKLANELKNSNYNITLIDRHNYHEFAPLFYQIASCGLEPGAICFPLRKEFRKADNIHIMLAEVLEIETEMHVIKTDTIEIMYDFLVIASGTATKYFGMENVKEYSFPLKTTSEGLMLRNQILLCLEKAASCNNINSRERMLTFVISGAGPAGVEIGGALGELKKYVITREYPDVNKDEVKIIIIEAADKVLRTMSDKSGRKSHQFLQELEVDVMLNTGIVDFKDGKVITDTGKEIPTDTLIWTAGVEGVKFKGLTTEDYGPSNRLLVDNYNRLINHPNIAAIGDCAFVKEPIGNFVNQQVAQVAIQQAKNLSRNLKKKSFVYKFIYNDKGSMATIGRNRAVVDLKYKKFAGKFAWWTWLSVHLVTLVGVRNKIVTLINWVWNYFTYNSSLRILVKPADRKNRPEPECDESNDNKCPTS